MEDTTEIINANDSVWLKAKYNGKTVFATPTYIIDKNTLDDIPDDKFIYLMVLNSDNNGGNPVYYNLFGSWYVVSNTRLASLSTVIYPQEFTFDLENTDAVKFKYGKLFDKECVCVYSSKLEIPQQFVELLALKADDISCVNLNGMYFLAKCSQEELVDMFIHTFEDDLYDITDFEDKLPITDERVGKFFNLI